MADPRTVPQMQADALIAIVTHVLGCDRKDLPLATVATIVRITEKDLTTGTGHATIDGIDQPISIGTARRMAAAGNIIPIDWWLRDDGPTDLGNGTSRKYDPIKRRRRAVL
jgi:5-methylcytosine-specific restriction protein A